MKSGFRSLLLLGALLSVAAGLRAEGVSLGPLTLDVVLADAHRLAARHDGAQVVRVEGASMLPFFGEGSVLVTKPVAPERLRMGMVVVYRNRFGETVSHRIERRDDAGWVGRGFNHADEDSTRVSGASLFSVG